MARRLSRPHIAASTAALALVLAGCGSSAQSVPAEGSRESAAGPASGQVTLYSPAAGELTDVYAAFNMEHPDIEINPVRLVGQELGTRVRSEVTSGQQVADIVITTTTSAFGPWGSEDTADWFEPFLPEGASLLAADAVNEEQGWFAPFSSGFGIAYNSDTLDEADLPTSWDDVIDSKWRGQLVMPDPRQLSLSSISIAALLDAGVIDESWLDDLAALDPRIVDGGPAVGQSMGSGESGLGFWGTGFVTNAAAAGSPVGWTDVPPTQSMNAAVLLAGAPNPDAAKAFLSWLISENGQAALAAAGYIPQIEGATLPDLITEEALAESTVIPPYEDIDPAIQDVLARFDELLG
ncbi:ABC transporter substrate-binding protein [Microbacterium sp. CPCC 204701]|uniref:ABC transporter substrate-binding protein n=1 Tax=Microbacterium sp. CPCC 204701 TaxID=2493084 RepID=UPI000FD7B881|nr:extracellular solute-binding protein [Microbacterium sp. CPCC 204701]